MKTLLLIIALLVGITSSAQTYKVSETGKLVKVDTIGTTKVASTLSGYTLTIKGIEYPVYKSPRGKYYILRVSKNTGNEYKQYIKVE